MLILWEGGWGTEIRDVYILGGLVPCAVWGGGGGVWGQTSEMLILGGGGDRGVLGQVLGMLIL